MPRTLSKPGGLGPVTRRPIRPGDRVTVPETVECEVNGGVIRVAAGTTLTVRAVRGDEVLILGGSEPVWIPARLVRVDTWGGA